jgi:hypothetical protein
MAKAKGPKSVYVCQLCGAQQPRWMGKCPDCGEWSSLIDTLFSTTVRAFCRSRYSTRELSQRALTETTCFLDRYVYALFSVIYLMMIRERQVMSQSEKTIPNNLISSPVASARYGD